MTGTVSILLPRLLCQIQPSGGSAYEDALNNISFDGERGASALDLYGGEYLLRYMLDFETRDSETLLNVKEMTAPFDYKLTVRDTSREDGERRHLVYRGPTPERDDVAVIWRDTTGWEKEDYERDRDFVKEQGMADGAKDVFVNGDSLIPESRPLEATFKKLMLADAGVPAS